MNFFLHSFILFFSRARYVFLVFLMNIETPIFYNHTWQKKRKSSFFFFHQKSKHSLKFFIKTVSNSKVFAPMNSARVLERKTYFFLIIISFSSMIFFLQNNFFFIISHSFLRRKKTERSINGLCSLYNSHSGSRYQSGRGHFLVEPRP